MSIICSHPTGHTSMHAPQVVQAHSASGGIANSIRGRGPASPRANASPTRLSS